MCRNTKAELIKAINLFFIILDLKKSDLIQFWRQDLKFWRRLLAGKFWRRLFGGKVDLQPQNLLRID